MSVYTNDIDTLRQMISQSIPQLLNSIITIVNVFIYMVILNIPLTIFETNIFEAVYNIEKSPCYLCARMRRGHLYSKAKELGCGALCFEGNIDFYGKSGFRQASEFGIRYHGLPEGEDASFFLCEELMPGYLNGITGEYAPPAGYLVNEKEAEAFDREFPYMEKKKLPGQIFEGDIR